MPIKPLLPQTPFIARLERERLTIRLWITCIMLPIAALAIMWALKVPIIPGLSLFQTYAPLMSLLLLVGIGILMCWHFKMKPLILGKLRHVLMKHRSDIKQKKLYTNNFIKLIQNGLSIDARNLHQSNISDEKCSDNKILNEKMVSTLDDYLKNYNQCSTLDKIVYRAEIIALIQTGADVDAKEYRGYTPLMIAINRHDSILTGVLTKAGIQRSLKNFEKTQEQLDAKASGIPPLFCSFSSDSSEEEDSDNDSVVFQRSRSCSFSDSQSITSARGFTGGAMSSPRSNDAKYASGPTSSSGT